MNSDCKRQTHKTVNQTKMTRYLVIKWSSDALSYWYILLELYIWKDLGWEAKHKHAKTNHISYMEGAVNGRFELTFLFKTWINSGQGMDKWVPFLFEWKNYLLSFLAYCKEGEKMLHEHEVHRFPSDWTERVTIKYYSWFSSSMNLQNGWQCMRRKFGYKLHCNTRMVFLFASNSSFESQHGTEAALEIWEETQTTVKWNQWMWSAILKCQSREVKKPQVSLLKPQLGIYRKHNIQESSQLWNVIENSIKRWKHL